MKIELEFWKQNSQKSTLYLMNLFKAANAWNGFTFLESNEVKALSCMNGKANLADGEEVSNFEE